MLCYLYYIFHEKNALDAYPIALRKMEMITPFKNTCAFPV